MIKNKDKIMDVLKEVNRAMTTTELAEKTGIDITNITRYTKALENEGLVDRKTEQKGKIRYVNISLRVVREVKTTVLEILKDKLQVPPPIKNPPLITRLPNNHLDQSLLLTAVNNYLIGYRKAYNNSKDKPFSETRKKYEALLREKEKLEKLIREE